MIMEQAHDPEATDTLGEWLRRDAAHARLQRAVDALRAGGGGRSRVDSAAVAPYLDRRRVSRPELERLDRDPALRRQVAAAARLVSGDLRRRSARPHWLGRTGMLLAAAASLTALLLVPRYFSGVPAADHRAPAMAPPTWNLHDRVVGTGRLVEWSPVPGVAEYRVDVTTRTGEVVFSARTSDTSLLITPDSLPAGMPYFVRVRARLDVDRWATSGFRELVVP